MYRPQPEDFDDMATSAITASNAEPFPRADHKAKKHGRPVRQRRNEQIGGGHFVFRRGRTTGRIKTGSILAGRMPFEHPNVASARTEAQRLQKLHGGRYDVLSVSATIDGAVDEDWDRVPAGWEA